MKTKINKLEIKTYDETKHKNILEEFKNESKSKFINEIPERLISSKNKESIEFPGAFIIAYENEDCGYVYFSSKSFDSIFVELSILKEKRNKGIGKLIIHELSDYLFKNYNLKEIRADVSPSNIKSINMLSSLNFYPDDEKYESNNYYGNIEFVMDNPNYINKRRK